jgi:UDP-glucose 4-epimerase
MGSSVSITIFSRDECKHYRMMQKMQELGIGEQVRFIIGDVRDYARVRQTVQGHGIIINAFAMKHVPHCEASPTEAIATNILGAQNVIRAVEESGIVARVLFVSTDKAVEPVNVYGMSKALQERIYQSSSLNCVGVRYGNVLSSSGSVLPFFRERAQAGQELPVTDPDMTRFFISFEQAVEMIWMALWSGRQKSIMVPVLSSARIGDIAEIFSEKYGVACKTVGVRPGEKTHEVLMTESEAAGAEQVDKYYEVYPETDKFRTHRAGNSNMGLFMSSVPVMEKTAVKEFLEQHEML